MLNNNTYISYFPIMRYLQYIIKKHYVIIFFLFLFLGGPYAYASSSFFRFIVHNNTSNHTILIHKTGLSKCALFKHTEGYELAPKESTPHFFFHQYKSCKYVEAMWKIDIKDKQKRLLCSYNMVFIIKPHGLDWSYILRFLAAQNTIQKCTTKVEMKSLNGYKVGPYEVASGHKYYGFGIKIDQQDHITYSRTPLCKSCNLG